MASFDLKPTATPAGVISKLREIGFVRIQGYQTDVSPIRDELLDLFETLPECDDYTYGKAARTDQNWDLTRTPRTAEFFRDSQWMHQVAHSHQTITCGVNRDIFSTFDYRYDRRESANGWAHFDRLWRFKFFLHVTDIEEGCGPLSAAIGSHHVGKELRLQDNTRHRFGRHYGDAGICENWASSQNHHPDVRYELTPIYGDAGTLIIFDSDVIHKGGKVKDGRRRIVARGHSW